jgi:hypothetical protein
MNTPYKKKYENGLLKNPITKHEPYRNLGENRKERRQKYNEAREFNNRNTFPLVVVPFGKGKFYKYTKRVQTFVTKLPGFKTKSKTITHHIEL